MKVEEFWEFANRIDNRAKALDLIGGEVVEWPRPYRKHGTVCALVGFALVKYADRVRWGCPTGGNAGVILSRDPATVVGPDAAFYADGGAEDLLTGWSLQPPLLAVEVLSPDDNAGQHARKVAAYLASGVHTVWVIDYEAKEVAVHRRGTPVVVRGGDDELTHDELLGFSARVTNFFRLPGERHSAA